MLLVHKDSISGRQTKPTTSQRHPAQRGFHRSFSFLRQLKGALTGILGSSQGYHRHYYAMQ